jgi:uncharacterized protein YbjT (DUF2867 family)
VNPPPDQREAPTALDRVLVTGANGQIGMRLIDRLGREKPKVLVRAIVRSKRAAMALEKLAEDIRPEISVVDYRDADALADAARDCSHAVHLVGILKQTATSRYEDAHEASTRAIAEAATAARLQRIVYVSILGTNAHSPNACLASKGRAERALLDGKTPALILRVPMVIGPGDFTAHIVRREALARFLPLAAGGRSRTQPIFADDVVDAIVAGLYRDDLDNLVLDLAGPESVSQRAFIERAAKLFDRRPRFISIPKALVLFFAGLAERWFANPPMTRSALEVILADDSVDPKPAAETLGIELTSLDEILRRCVGPGADSSSRNQTER